MNMDVTCAGEMVEQMFAFGLDAFEFATVEFGGLFGKASLRRADLNFVPCQVALVIPCDSVDRVSFGHRVLSLV